MRTKETVAARLQAIEQAIINKRKEGKKASSYAEGQAYILKWVLGER